MTQTQDGTARRAVIEAALAEYPDLTSETLADVIAWFRKEASAYDVAMVASNAAIAERYRRFRADHIDRLTIKDLMKGVAFAAAIAVIGVLIIWRAL
ncbi:MAG: hypothetical protein WCY29_00235 [Novosphingobium sp.]